MMARPGTHEPSLLFNLAYEKMIQAAKTGEKPLEIEKIPPGIANKVWNDCEIKDIVATGTQPRLSPWFSTMVVQPPTRFTVRIETNIYGQHQTPEPSSTYDPAQYAVRYFDHKSTISMSFENKPDITWVRTSSRYVEPDDESSYDESDLEMMGSDDEEMSWIRQEKEERRFERKKEREEREKEKRERFAKQYKLMLERIDRYCKLFRTEIHELEIVWSNLKYNMLSGSKNWSRIEKARNVTIEKCEDSEFLIDLVSNRHKSGLPTTTRLITLNSPIQSSLDLFPNLNIRFGTLNIKNHTHSDFMDLVERLLPTVDLLDLRIPGSLSQDVELFKSRFNLPKPNPSFLSEFATTEDNVDFNEEEWLTGYTMSYDGSAMAFFFIGGHYKGTFTRMVARRYIHKSTLPDLYEQVEGRWIWRGP